MSNTAQSAASTRIASLLDANSFVEIGGQITARSTDFNLSAKVTEKMMSYLRPLIQGEVPVIYKNGIPAHLILY